MTTVNNPVNTQTTQSNETPMSHHHHHHHHTLNVLHKCPHFDGKEKPYPCELCSQYHSLNMSTIHKSLDSLASGQRSTIDRSMTENQERSKLLSLSLAPTHFPHTGLPLIQSTPINQNHQRRLSISSTSSSLNGENETKNGGNKHFVCTICHRFFTQKGNLKTHMMIHTGEKPYHCQICCKSFTQKGNVDTHMKIHTGERDYNCASCDKKFTQKGNLKTHVRSVHTKEKPYVCGFCGKSFSQKGNMHTHLRTHNKDERFPCTICGRTFSQKGNLKTHIQRHNGTLASRRYGTKKLATSNQQPSPMRLIPIGSAFPGSMNFIDPSRCDRMSMKVSEIPSPSSSDSHSMNNHAPNHQTHLMNAHPLSVNTSVQAINAVQNEAIGLTQLKISPNSDQNRENSLENVQNPHHLFVPNNQTMNAPGLAFGSTSSHSPTSRVLYSTPPTNMLAAHASSWLTNNNTAASIGAKYRQLGHYENFGFSAYSTFAVNGGAVSQVTPLSRLSVLATAGNGGVDTKMMSDSAMITSNHNYGQLIQ